MKFLQKIRPDNGIGVAACQIINDNFLDLTKTPSTLSLIQNFTITPNGNYESILVDATAANLTITLPGPTGEQKYRVVKTDATANTVTITDPINLISGAGTVVLVGQYNYVWVEAGSQEWLIIASG